MAANLTEFEGEILDVSRECAEIGVTPQPVYRKEIDSLYFFTSDLPSCRKRVNRRINVHIADNGEISGFEIKHWSRLVRRMQRYKVKQIVEDHPVLGFFLMIALESEGDEPG